MVTAEIITNDAIKGIIEAQITENPEIREEYLKKFDNIRKGKFIRIGTIGDFKKRYK